MLIYGASGHAKVVVDCLKSMNERILAVFDDDRSKNLFLEYVVINDYARDIYPNEPVIIAIGDNKTRKKLSEEKITHSFGRARHVSSVVEHHVDIGDGTVIFHQSVIQAGAEIGRQVIINTSASVDHDCRIGDYVHIAPHVTLCGDVWVGEGTLVGAGSVVVPGIRIGKWCVIGAGSVIRKDIPDFSLVAGNPGKIIRSNKS